MAQDTPISLQIAESLSKNLNKCPIEGDFVLYDYVDPEALDKLFESSSGEIAVTIEVENMDITIKSNGDAEIAIIR